MKWGSNSCRHRTSMSFHSLWCTAKPSWWKAKYRCSNRTRNRWAQWSTTSWTNNKPAMSLGHLWSRTFSMKTAEWCWRWWSRWTPSLVIWNYYMRIQKHVVIRLKQRLTSSKSSWVCKWLLSMVPVAGRCPCRWHSPRWEEECFLMLVC